jgi:hypothetical protein
MNPAKNRFFMEQPSAMSRQSSVISHQSSGKATPTPSLFVGGRGYLMADG